jgi:hypothetical protein
MEIEIIIQMNIIDLLIMNIYNIILFDINFIDLMLYVYSFHYFIILIF